MSMPRSKEARLFYRAAVQRFEDADVLRSQGRNTGAVYLAGYAVECNLKALVLAHVSSRLKEQILSEFHGNRAHNLDWLNFMCREKARLVIPRNVNHQMLQVAAWSTNLRYESRTLSNQETEDFFRVVLVIVNWAEGRM